MKNELSSKLSIIQNKINPNSMKTRIGYFVSILLISISCNESIENQLLKDIKPVLDSYKHGETEASELEKIKIFFLKKRYLFRIYENLSKFAPR